MKLSHSLKCNLSAGVLGFLALGLGSTSVFAATATTTFAVTATVQATCTVNATVLAFGIYASTAESDAQSTITVTCTNGTTYNIGLNAGTASGATVTTRQMTGPSGALLNYGLFSDATHATNWGATVNTDTVAGTGNGGAQAHLVYGQILSGHFVTTGDYADTITATVTY